MRELLYLFLFLAAACVPGSEVGPPSKADLQNFSIEVPEGWRRFEPSEYFMLTREEVFSQYILVQQREVDKPFEYTESRLKKEMLPKEAAAVILEEMSSDVHLVNFRSTEPIPAQIGRYNGFRIEFGHQNTNGQEFKTIFFGLVEGDWFFSLRYSAQEEKYSDEDIVAFKKVVYSFRIVEG